MNKEIRSEKAEARMHSDREARGSETAVFVRVRSYHTFVQAFRIIVDTRRARAMDWHISGCCAWTHFH